MRPNHITLSAKAFLLLSFTVAGIRADDPATGPAPRVGVLGDVKTITFAGCKQTPADQVRAAIAGDTECQIAALPSGDLHDYLSTLLARLREGYRASGYIAGEISVAATGDHVAITINEGQRFFNGDIVVNAPPAVDATALKKRMLAAAPQVPEVMFTRQDDGEFEARVGLPSPNEGSQNAAWSPGMSTDFRPDAREALEQSAVEEMEAQGFLRAKVTASLKRHDNVADLQLEITPGHKARVSSITAVGAGRNSADEIIKVAGLKVGDPIDNRVMTRAALVLFETGRFTSEAIHVRPDLQADGDFELELNIEESATAPLLTEPLTPEQTAMLRLAAYVRSWSHGGAEDAVLTLSGANGGKVIVTSRGEVAVQGALKDFPVVTAWTGPEFALLMTPAGLDFFRKDLNVHGTLALNSGNAVAQIELHSHHFFLGFGAQSAPMPADATHLRLLVEPVALLEMTMQKGANFSRQDGQLTFNSGSVTVKVNEASGRLIRLDVPTAVPGGPVGTVTMEKGAFAALRTLLNDQYKLARQVKASTDVAIYIRVLLKAIAVGRLSGEGFTDAQRAKAGSAVDKLITPELLTFLEAFIATDTPAARAEKFDIPPTKSTTADMAGMIRMMAQEAFKDTRGLWTRGTWPESLTAQGLLNAASDNKHFDEELRMFYRDDSHGPLAMLAAAEMFNFTEHDLCRPVADKGLERLTADAFIADCRPLMDDKTAMGHAMLQALENVRSLDEEEVDALLLLGSDDKARDGLKSMWAALKADKEKPIGEAWEPVLRVWWDKYGKELIRERLRHYSPAI